MCSPFTVLYIHWGAQTVALFVIQPGEGKNQERERSALCSAKSSHLKHLILEGKVFYIRSITLVASQTVLLVALDDWLSKLQGLW